MEGEVEDKEPVPLPQCYFCRKLSSEVCLSRKQSQGCFWYQERLRKFTVVK